MLLKKLDEIVLHVNGLFEGYKQSYLVYHNADHTMQVAARAREIASQQIIDPTSLFVLLSAAWFHDTGHLFGEAEGHEERSVQQMELFLAEIDIPSSVRLEVARCIRATRKEFHPNSDVEKIIRDADTYHLGTPEFEKMNKLVWLELKLRHQELPADWTATSLAFLKTHVFYTDYCRSLLSAGKARNIELLERKLKDF